MVNKKDMYKLTGLFYLYALSQTGSKREVADSLGVSVDTINKYLSDLEAELKTKFFVSSGRGTIITPEGKQILQIAEEVRKSVRKLDNYGDMAANYAGTVRLWMPDAVSQFLKAEEVAAFFKKYPSIQLQSKITNELPDMSALEADIYAGYEMPDNPDLVLVHTQKVCGSLFASESYLQTFGEPKDMDDLLQNHRLCFQEGNLSLGKEFCNLFTMAQNVVYKTTSIASLRAALKAGVGIGVCPMYWGNANLVHLGNLNFNFSVEIILLAHKDTKDMPRIRVVLDFIKELMQKSSTKSGCRCGL